MKKLLTAVLATFTLATAAVVLASPASAANTCTVTWTPTSTFSATPNNALLSWTSSTDCPLDPSDNGNNIDLIGSWNDPTGAQVQEIDLAYNYSTKDWGTNGTISITANSFYKSGIWTLTPKGLSDQASSGYTITYQGGTVDVRRGGTATISSSGLNGNVTLNTTVSRWSEYTNQWATVPAGTAVYWQRYINGGWQNFATTNTNSSGFATVNFNTTQSPVQYRAAVPVNSEDWAIYSGSTFR